jgi:hypothetical protein
LFFLHKKAPKKLKKLTVQKHYTTPTIALIESYALGDRRCGPPPRKSKDTDRKDKTPTTQNQTPTEQPQKTIG